MCSKCRAEKPFEAFSKLSKAADGLQSYCKACMREYFVARRPEITARIMARRKKQVRLLGMLVRNYLLEHPCVDCGESDPIVLDFDHVRGKKVGVISLMICSATTEQRLTEEIAKCEVRCSNCHRRKTAKQFNWYAWLSDEEATPDGARGSGT